MDDEFCCDQTVRGIQEKLMKRRMRTVNGRMVYRFHHNCVLLPERKNEHNRCIHHSGTISGNS